jgi:hypothetical protein
MSDSLKAPTLDIQSLLVKRREKNKPKDKVAHREILSQAHQSIVKASDKLETQCVITIPYMSVGVPAYNHQECVDYVTRHLIDNGFNVSRESSIRYRVSWAHHETGGVV